MRSEATNIFLQISIDIDEAIDTATMRIPPMLAQPIIENAIEHGIKHKETKGHHP